MSQQLHLLRQVRGPTSRTLRCLHAPIVQARQASTESNSSSTAPKNEPTPSSTKASQDTQPPKKKKSQAELDKELELKMQGLSGDGGESGIEYEDGQPVAMKRSVRNNMFRYI